MFLVIIYLIIHIYMFLSILAINWKSQGENSYPDDGYLTTIKYVYLYNELNKLISITKLCSLIYFKIISGSPTWKISSHLHFLFVKMSTILSTISIFLS